MEADNQDRADRLEARLEELQGKLDEIDSRIDEIEEVIEATNDSMDEVRDTMDDAKDQMNDAQEAAEDAKAADADAAEAQFDLGEQWDKAMEGLNQMLQKGLQKVSDTLEHVDFESIGQDVSSAVNKASQNVKTALNEVKDNRQKPGGVGDYRVSGSGVLDGGCYNRITCTGACKVSSDLVCRGISTSGSFHACGNVDCAARFAPAAHSTARAMWRRAAFRQRLHEDPGQPQERPVEYPRQYAGGRQYLRRRDAGQWQPEGGR